MPCNVSLGDNNIVETIRLGSIVIEVMVKGKIKRICIMDALDVPKLEVNVLLLSKFSLNELKM